MPEHDSDFDERLARRLRAYEARIPDEEVPMTSTLRPRSRWARAASVVAAGTVAGVVLAIVLLSRPTPTAEDPSPSATSGAPSASASPTESAEPTATPTASTDATLAAREGWRAVQVAEAGLRGSVNGVAAWGDGLIAFGATEGAEGGIWLSSDGETWELAEVPESPPDTAVFLTDVERVADGYVAVGTLGHPLGSGPMGSVIWTSSDGRSWVEAPGSGDVRNEILGSLVVRSDTILAAGSSLWRSTDGGSTWSSIDPLDADGWNISGMLAHDGGFIAAGGTGGFETGEAVIWTSPDGASWTRIDLEGEDVTDVALLPDGRFVAVGEGGNAVLAWLSEDGVIWTPTPADAACCMVDLASTPSGVVGVGFGPTPGGVVGATTDGTTWSSETGIEGALNQVIYHERFGVVAGGATTDNAPAVIYGPHPYP